jgi:hypothetical protein
METIFILLHKHWHEEPNWDFLKYLSPFAVMIITYLLNRWLQKRRRKHDIKERLSNDIIDTCDKMIRYAKSAEDNILIHRYYCYCQLLHKKDSFESIAS